MPQSRSHFHLSTARTFAKLMDEQFSIFGVKFGLDSILGLVPGVGDVISTLFSFYLIWIATEIKVPQHKIWEMIRNVFFDVLIGSIPLVGDIGDVFLRVNVTNLKILEEYVPKEPKTDDVLEGEVI